MLQIGAYDINSPSQAPPLRTRASLEAQTVHSKKKRGRTLTVGVAGIFGFAAAAFFHEVTRSAGSINSGFTMPPSRLICRRRPKVGGLKKKSRDRAEEGGNTAEMMGVRDFIEVNEISSAFEPPHIFPTSPSKKKATCIYVKRKKKQPSLPPHTRESRPARGPGPRSDPLMTYCGLTSKPSA